MNKYLHESLLTVLTIAMLSSTTCGLSQASNINKNSSSMISSSQYLDTSNSKSTSKQFSVPLNNRIVNSDQHPLTPKEQQMNKKLANEVAMFAQQRQKYYYPNIAINARTLAGYRTANGKYEVKSNKLFRSNNLHALSLSGSKQLHQLHINRIIDLRDFSQVKRLPDPNEKIPNTDLYFTDDANPNIQITNLPIYSQREQKMNHNKIHEYGEAYAYRTMLSTNRKARKNYRKALKIILRHKNGAVLYHCIEGRDRTGVLSVILLSALGVKKSDIYKDYLLTDFYNHKHPYIEQYQQLNAFFNTINYKYGGMRNYLHKLGLNNKDITELRRTYLIRVK